MAAGAADPDPAMKLLEQVSSFQTEIQYLSRNSIWVNVTHIESPSNFYVRPIVYSEYLSEFEKPDMASPAELQVGAIIVFKSKTVEKYVRGEIVDEDFEDEDSVFSILAIDNGFVEKNVPSIEIYKPKNDAPIPPLATKCKLAQCEPLITREWSKDAINAMKDYVGTEPARMIVRCATEKTLIVDLINSVEDIANIMVLSEFAGLGYSCNKMNCFEAPRQDQVFYTYRELHLDQTLHVKVLRGPKNYSLNSFYVAEVNEYKKYLKEKSNITNYLRSSKRLPFENLKVGTPVGGIYDFSACLYGRGLITEVIEPGDKAKVLFVDSGETHVLSMSRMVLLPNSFCVDQPPLAIFCSADEKQAWDNGLPMFLYPGYEFDIVIKEVGYKFEKPNIVHLKKK